MCIAADFRRRRGLLVFCFFDEFIWTDGIILYIDDERLKTERARAIKAKERSAQKISSFGSDGNVKIFSFVLLIK